MAKFLGTTGLQRLWQRIKDYAKITVTNNVSTIVIGDNSITPLTEHQDISGKVDKTTTVNGHALSGNVTVTASDIGVAAGAEVNVNADWNATSGDAEILNKPTIPAAVTESTVSGWGFTKNTGTYSKPSTGIPESDLAQAVKDKLTAASNAIPSSEKGVPGGVVDLDENGLIDSSYLPSFVDDVVEAWARSGATPLSENWLTETQGTEVPIEPTSGKIYVLMADSGEYTANSQFRWGGTTYVKLNDGGVSAITNAEIDSITSN